MPQFVFGGGALYALRTDIATAAPVRFGALQEIEVDFAADLKELYGQGQYALALARGKAKITGKAKFAQLNGALFNAVYFGAASATGQSLVAQNEAATVPASSPETVTVQNAAGFLADLGVLYAATGLALTKVSASPTQGQYTVTTGGVYGFAAADAGAGILISYGYTGTGGTSLAIANQPMGTAPVFRVTLAEQFQGKELTLQLNACIASKLSLPSKLDDWLMSDFEFQAQSDAAGNIGVISFGE